MINYPSGPSHFSPRRQIRPPESKAARSNIENRGPAVRVPGLPRLDHSCQGATVLVLYIYISHKIFRKKIKGKVGGFQEGFIFSVSHPENISFHPSCP